MKSWFLIIVWIALGVILGVGLYPVVGKSAVLVPAGWCAGSVLGGIGGAVFTLGSHRRDRRLRRTFSAAIGAGIMAIFLGLWPLEIIGLWKIASVAIVTVIVPPLTVVLCLEINEVLKR